MKPGKPLFFGTWHGSDQPDAVGRIGNPSQSPNTLVFGLPGNPVSALVCFELFVRPAVRQLMGHPQAGPRMVQAVLTDDFVYKTDRPTYHPAWLEASEGVWRVCPVPWFGSSDLRGLMRANAFVVLPTGEHQHRAGQSFPVLRFDLD
jgi:molybdopterin molybdotransferase